MEFARVARRIENYDGALESLERALGQAELAHDTHSMNIILLHKADTLIAAGRDSEAGPILNGVLSAAPHVNQPGFAAYAQVTMGLLHQARNQWEAARLCYEQAKAIALETTSLGAEARALGYLADIYLHENNASYAVRLLEEALPKLNQAGDLELGSYFVGRLGEALILNGQEANGRHLISRALALAEQMQDRAMTRRWATACGEGAFLTQQYTEAQTFYKRALLFSKEESSSDYVRLLTRLATISWRLNSPEEAKIYAEKALQLGKAGSDPQLLAEAHSAYGASLRATGNTLEAIPHLQIAIDALQPPLTRADLTMLRNLASAYSDTQQLEPAQALYARALAAAESSGDKLSRAELQRDLGLIAFQHGNAAEALQQWSNALSYFEEINDYNTAARLYCDVGNVRRALGQSGRAVRDYEKALMGLNHITDLATRGLVLANAANIYSDQGDTQSASAFFTESIDIAERLSQHEAESTRRGNYGWFLIMTGEARRAIEVLTKAMLISRTNRLALPLAVQTDNLGLAYDALGQYKTALGHHEDALRLLADVVMPSPRWEAAIKINIGKTRLALGEPEDALRLFDEALVLARQTKDYETLIGGTIAKAHAQLRQGNSADALIQDAIAIAKGAEMRRLTADALAMDSESLALRGEMPAAQKRWEEARRLYLMLGAPQAKQPPFWLNSASTEPA
jgi:tetratricopeptide (TPR) repeat protein